MEAHGGRIRAESGRVSDVADRPVIFISGYGRDETVARALEVGAADYIPGVEVCGV